MINNDYLKNFTQFNSYRHQVLTKYKSRTYQMPINLETINSFFNKDFRPEEAKNFIKKQTRNHDKKNLNNFEEKARSQIGDKLYEAFIKNYTYKLSSKDEGSMLFFPSQLKHQVHPFYNCDETRISISGNIMLGIPSTTLGTIRMTPKD